ncbi:hypothetical protein [Bradyrhizobium archetypum]|uniref:Uncharacterized protein n=1 Tax=Bradyrhizobium archetypum TaxID=2721160 RepID=A0A7Y4H024_9BRAD|nr:hypothetical protein [Bradyrhizobium archetypum]NOJ44918.1 hypothetical protein [Bradyrhizobium archetypum]
MSDKKDDRLSPEETQARFEAALRGAMKTPHKPLKAKKAAKKNKAKKKPGK